jgi:hypothetical protein
LRNTRHGAALRCVDRSGFAVGACERRRLGDRLGDRLDESIARDREAAPEDSGEAPDGCFDRCADGWRNAGQARAAGVAVSALRHDLAVADRRRDQDAIAGRRAQLNR